MADQPISCECVEEYLFGSGLQLRHYFIERTPVSEIIGYVNDQGREFDLIIDDPMLAAAAKNRLLALGVRVATIGGGSPLADG